MKHPPHAPTRAAAWCLLLSLGLSACTTVKTQAYNAWNHIRSLVVFQDTSRESYGVDIVAHPGANFGMVGTLVAQLDMSSKSSRLTQALDPQTTALQERLAVRLARALSAEGYDSTVVPVAGDRSRREAVPAALPVPADAYITLDVQARYIAAGPSSDYLPYVRVSVAQNDTRTGKVLYEDTLAYGYDQDNAHVVHLPSDNRYRFKDIDSLLSNPDKAREGLQAGVDAIVAQIASDLQR